MEKPVAIVEITNSAIRLLVGTMVDDKPVVLYMTELPSDDMLSRGEIKDLAGVIQAVNSFSNIVDPNHKIKLNVNDCVVVYPALGLQVFTCDKTTNIVSQSSIVENIDISNLISQVQKETPANGNKIVDIVPDAFILESGKGYSVPPIGEKSSYITLKCKVHTLPMRSLGEYERVFDGSKLHVKRVMIEPYAIAELARRNEKMPKSYFLVDMGADITTISLIGNYSPFGSVYFPLGGNDLIKEISNEFSIDVEKAKELMELYGLEERELAFMPTVCTSVASDGMIKSYTPYDLNRIIDKFFESYFSQFNVALQTLLNGYKAETMKKLPLVVTGGFSKLNGLQTLLNKQFAASEGIYFLSPTSIGARDPKYTSLVGALIVSHLNKGSLNDQTSRVSKVERE